MSTELKGPKKNAAQKLRDLYFKVTKRPLSPENRKNIEDLLKDRKAQIEKNRPRKIAKSDADTELS